MNDTLIRGLARTPAVRFAFTECTALCRDGIIAHNADPVGGAVFSEALTAGALLAVLLEGEEKYSVRIDYPGTIRSLLIEVNAAADLRGIIGNPGPAAAGDASPDTLFGAGEARISVVKSAGGKVLQSGLIRCGMASPAADTAMFFSISDQVETEIAAAHRFRPDPGDPVAIAAGFLLQAMPGCDLEEFGRVRERLHAAEFRALLADGAPPLETRLRRLLTLAGIDLAAGNVAYTAAGVPGYRCHCSRETMRNALLTLGAAELKKLFAENPSPTITCNFCRKKYAFRREEVL